MVPTRSKGFSGFTACTPRCGPWKTAPLALSGQCLARGRQVRYRHVMTTPMARTVCLTAAALFLSACADTAKAPATSKEGERPAKDAETKAATPATPVEAKVEAGVKIACFGANACSGQTQCNVPDGRFAPGSKGNACAAQNECKGKGWLSLTASECEVEGGKPL